MRQAPETNPSATVGYRWRPPVAFREIGDRISGVMDDIFGSTRTLLTIDQVAHRLGVSSRHVRRLVAERRIPYTKWGRLLRFDSAAIEQWIEGCSVEATPGA